MRILIVEDDRDIRDFLTSSLERESFAVDSAADGERGLFLAQTNEYDLVILDNILPLKNGYEVCTQLRREGSNVPILLLSVKSEINDKAALLDAGADDYLTKPYSYTELLARIRALTRRAPVVQTTTLSTGDLVLDTAACEVRRGKKDIYLTRKEFSLLELLLKNKGKVVSRGMILEHVWNAEGDPFSKTIETHIVNLRKKIETPAIKFIVSVPGRGYKIA